MRLQKLWVAFAVVLLAVLPAMTADASQSGAASGLNAPSISGVPADAVRSAEDGSSNLSALDITVPPVPDTIKVPAGNKVFLVGHGVGTQNYVCVPTGSGNDVAYVLFTPQATLFDDGQEIITHYFSPDPSEPNTNPAVVADGAIRVTWQALDTSIVWGRATGAANVTAGAVAWLRIERTGSKDGPTGGDTLTGTTFIQRLSTTGGLAPSTGCASRKDLGNTAFVPYTADYFFYEKEH